MRRRPTKRNGSARRGARRFAGAAAGGLVAVAVVAAGVAAHGQFRETSNRSADLIGALRERGLFESAAQLCHDGRDRSAPGSPDAAAWTARLASVLADQALESGEDSPRWAEAAAVCEQFLATYQDTERAPWVRLQAQLVELARARLAVLRYQAAPDEQERREAALVRLRPAIQELERFARELTERIPAARTGRLRDAAPAEDLELLLADVQLRLCEATLLRGDCYPPESSDALAAAGEAARLAERLITAPGAAAPSIDSARMLRAEALLRLDRTEEARTLIAAAENAAPDRRVALLVRSDLADGRLDAAAARLDAVATQHGASGPPDVRLDLARLRFLIARRASAGDTETAELSEWVEAIGQRHGSYWRRVAETVVLNHASDWSGSGDATLLAAEAARAVRQQRFAEAAERFDAAARAAAAADRDADAFQFGLQSAAALHKAGDARAAAERLAAVAVNHAEFPQAPQAHLQAALVASRSDDAEAIYERLLSDQLARWPGAAESMTARRWLDRYLQTQQRPVDAARLWSADEAAGGAAEAWIARCSEAWQNALRAAPDAEARDQLFPSADAALAEWVAAAEGRAAEQARALRTRLHALFAPPQQLASPAAASETTEAADDPEQSFLVDLLAFRRGAVEDPPTAPADAEPALIEDALRRLRADAWEADAEGRRRLADAIHSLLDAFPADDSRWATWHAEADAWRGDWRAAAKRLEAMAASGRRSEPLRHLARLLSDHPAAEAREHGLKTWNRIAAGHPAGDARWYEARLEAARLLVREEREEEAVRLLRYLLLTRPASDGEPHAQAKQLLDQLQR